MPPHPSPAPSPSAASDAKRLLRLARVGALATIDGEGGAPLTTLVGVASDWDGSPLFLMSELARHTRNLAVDARASLLLTSAGGRGDPLNRPRLTVGGPVTPHSDPTSRQRYLRRNPKAGLYASFADFSIRRLQIETIHFNGGFGRADALRPLDLLTPAGEIGQLVEAESRLLQEVQSLGVETISRLAGAPVGRKVWRPVGLDPEGFDLAAGETAARVDFSSPALDPDSWREQLREKLATFAAS
jgi:putative heme iron utilization protein